MARRSPSAALAPSSSIASDTSSTAASEALQHGLQHVGAEADALSNGTPEGFDPARRIKDAASPPLAQQPPDFRGVEQGLRLGVRIADDAAQRRERAPWRANTYAAPAASVDAAVASLGLAAIFELSSLLPWIIMGKKKPAVLVLRAATTKRIETLLI